MILNKFTELPEWLDVPLYPRLDCDVLTALVANIYRDKRPCPKKVWVDVYEPSDLNYIVALFKCRYPIVALFKCRYPIDVQTDMDTLLKILCLPEESMMDLKPLKHDIGVGNVEILAEFFFSKVGGDYGQGVGPV